MDTVINLPPLCLATDWDGTQDLTGWWLSEKLDGFRAYWDGQQLWSRNGSLFEAPDWFTRELPDLRLDGELWCGRGNLNHVAAITGRKNGDAAWHRAIYAVFDAPAIPEAFEERLWVLHDVLPRRGRYARVVAHSVCGGLSHLRETLAAVEALGGEGLMLRAPRSLYEMGRSTQLLKVKSLSDAEACVVEHRPRSIVLETDDGVQFAVICPAAQRPALGEVVSYQFSGRTPTRKPRCARLLRTEAIAYGNEGAAG